MNNWASSESVARLQAALGRSMDATEAARGELVLLRAQNRLQSEALGKLAAEVVATAAENQRLKAELKDALASEGKNLLEAMRAEVEVKRLKAAIRKHRDYTYDDRCVDDDRELYTVLDEPIPDLATPPDEEMAESCARWRAQRACPVVTLPPGKMTIRQLEDEVARLRAVLATLIAESTHPDTDPQRRYLVHGAFPRWFPTLEDAERAVGLWPPGQTPPPMSIEESRKAGVCRICRKPLFPSTGFNVRSDERAHIECLEREQATRPLSVADAREARVCRICREPVTITGPAGWPEEFMEMVWPVAFRLDFGAEFCHTACLEREQAAAPVVGQKAGEGTP